MARQLSPRGVEHWALQILDAWQRTSTADDARVEFKRVLPDDPQRVARRLAGHANSARGEDILWLVGVDEKEHRIVTGELPCDAADYWPKVWSKFEGPHPDLVGLSVDFEGTSILALGFCCDRVPYVVRTGIDAPRFETPWREGTRVDSATRSQLVRLLVPIAKAPTIEVRRVVADSGSIAVTLFVVPPTTEPLMLPMHHSVLEYGTASATAYELIGNGEQLVQPHPVLREAKGQGVYFYGPAEIVVKWRIGTFSPPQVCRLRLGFEPGRLEVIVAEGIPPR